MPILSESQPKKTVILVTGASGLVGSAVRELIMQSLAPSPTPSSPSSTTAEFSCPLSSASSDEMERADKETEFLFNKYRPDKVLHLAALVGGVAENILRPCDFLRQNLLINDNVMQMSAKYEVQKLVSCLSTCIFPDQVTLPLDETKIHLGPPHDTNYGYAYVKRLVDIQNRAYNDQYGLLFTAGIPTNVFGPGDNFNLESGHVMPCLIRKCYEAKMKRNPFIIWGTGSPLRQFIYSKDLARLFVWQMREYNFVDPIILSVSQDKEISIRDLAFLIADLMGFNGPVIFDASKPDGQYRKTVSNEKLMFLLRDAKRDFKFTPLRQALKETIQWFLSHHQIEENPKEKPRLRL